MLDVLKSTNYSNISSKILYIESIAMDKQLKRWMKSEFQLKNMDTRIILFKDQ